MLNGKKENMRVENQPGWVKPPRTLTLAELHELIEAKRAELSALEAEVFNREQGPRLEAIAQIRNIMRAQQLSIDDITG